MVYRHCDQSLKILHFIIAVDPIVRKNDDISMDEIKRLIHDGKVDNIVISPGPGSPAKDADIGGCSLSN